MIRLSANLSKKVPLPGVDYSSQQYGASLEIEVSDADKPEVIQGRIKELYGLLSSAIDEQIGAPATVKTLPPPAAPAPQPVRQAAPQQRNGVPVNRLPAASGNGNGNGRRVTATLAQQRAIHAIAKSLNLDMASLLADYNCADVSQLHIRDASKLIDDLKARQPSQK